LERLMMTSLFRTGLTLIAWTCAAGITSAQAPDEWPLAKDRITIGDVVYVTDANGLTIKGRLAAVNDAVQLKLKAGTRTIPNANVRRIQRRQPDSLLNGVLMGGAIGAIPGVYWLIADPNECTGMCPEDYVSIGVGVLVGWLIDRSISRKVTVYEAQPRGNRSLNMTLGPVVRQNRLGAQLAVTF
jgi:hypothetical protein